MAKNRVRDEEAIIQMYLQGYKRQEIVKHFGLDDSTVCSVLGRYRWNNPNKKLPEKALQVELSIIDKGKVKALYNAYWSLKDIAMECNVMEQTVVELLKMEGMI